MLNKKYYNDAFIGNKNITASFSKYGELLRLYYPKPDYRQFLDYFHTGIKVNDSDLIYLHYDVNNTYKQYYTENTNILNTQIENSYFKLRIKQIDFVLIDQDVVAKKYIFINDNDKDLNLNFLVHSSVMSTQNNMSSGMILDNSLVQYSHNSIFIITSNQDLLSHQVNNSNQSINSGVIYDKDYVGMSHDSSISYDLGTLKPGQTKEFNLYLYMNYENVDVSKAEEVINSLKKIDCNEALFEAEDYWKDFLKAHDTLKIELDGTERTSRIIDIYKRTILFLPLLLEESTGGVAATLEVDEKTDTCGRYSYCWPRDAVFIYNYIDHLDFEDEIELFYGKFLKETQTKSGLWEQRYYTDGKLAPCWGYQVDETALVVWGAWQHYKNEEKRTGKRIAKFIQDNLDMLEKATKFLEKYICYLLQDNDLLDTVIKEFETKYDFKDVDERYKHKSYDLWEENEGVHLFSLSAIYAAFESMIQIYKMLIRENKVYSGKKQEYDNLIQRYVEYKKRIKQYILENLVDKQKQVLVRNDNDRKCDISIIGACVPFKVFEPTDEIMKNTVDYINYTLRTFSSGYLRYQDDHYVGGEYPWIISTCWMGMYYNMIGDKKRYEECLKFVINSETNLGLLPEQCSNDFSERWVIGLAWSHVMFLGMLIDSN